MQISVALVGGRSGQQGTLSSPFLVKGRKRGNPNIAQVLGTFITEHSSGEKTCEQLFKDPKQAEAAAEQLTCIAAYFGFEGWLLNIENDLDAARIPNLLHFVRSGF